MTKKVLCYAVNSFWKLHAQWEFTILHNLRQCGADVRVVMCDGLYSDCDLFWKSSNPRHPYSCLQCQARNTDTASKMLTPYEWLGRYLKPDDFKAARAWADSLSVKELEEASFEGWELGDYVRSSLNTHFRSTTLEHGDEEQMGTYRSYLYSAAVAVRGLNSLLDEYQPDVIFLFNGRQSSTRVMFELARKRGIRVIVHERGYAKETMSFRENETCVGLGLFQGAWDVWGDVPLSSHELNNLQDYLHKREFGENTTWLSWSPPPQELDTLYSDLKLDPNLPVWVLFTSSEDEIAGHRSLMGDFGDQMEWINETIEYIRENPKIQLVIRVHPNTDGERSTGANPKGAQVFIELAKHVPDNVRVVQPGDPISSYTLMEMAQCGLVLCSLTSVEMACKGKKALVAGGGPGRMPLLTSVDSADNYRSILKEFRKSVSDEPDLELQRLAYRYAYAIFFRVNLHFPLVTMPNHATGKLNYQSLSDLAPGQDATLDRVADIVLNDASVVPAPKLAELHRSERSEKQWFSNLKSTTKPEGLSSRSEKNTIHSVRNPA